MSRRGRPVTPGPPRQTGRLKDELRALRGLAPYLWPRGSIELRVRVVLAVVFLIAGRIVNIYVPFLYKHAVDALAPVKGGLPAAAVAVPVAAIVAYGFARVMSQGFNELRDAVFAKVAQRAVRRIALSTFRHLHALSLRFHLDRRTGGLSRAIERGTAGIDFLLSFMLFNVVPTLFEILLVCGILWRLLRLALCRGHARDDRRLCRLHLLGHRLAGALPPRDERARQRGQHQGDRQPAQLRDGQVFRQRGARGAALRRARCRPMSSAAVRSETTLALLNLGQGVIIACGLVAVMLLAGAGRRRRRA